MKRFKKMIINGADFTLKNEVVKYNDIKKMEFKTLEQCYNKCSYYKYKVFNYWNLYYAHITKNYNNLYEVVE